MPNSRGYHKMQIQLTTRLFFRFPLFSPELGGELLLSDAFPGVSTRTCGVDTRPGGPDGALPMVSGSVLEASLNEPLFERAASPPARDRMNEPGSPTSGASSMYSSPYCVNRLNESAKLRVSWKLELAVDIPRPALLSDCVSAVEEGPASGIGVFSLLCWDACCPGSTARVLGGIYVWP